jgi:hypothetical protein
VAKVIPGTTKSSSWIQIRESRIALTNVVSPVLGFPLATWHFLIRCAKLSEVRTEASDFRCRTEFFLALPCFSRSDREVTDPEPEDSMTRPENGVLNRVV